MNATGRELVGVDGANIYTAPVYDGPQENTHEQPTGRTFVEIGPDNLEWVNLDTIHLLKQVRQEYDQRDIESLAYSIIKDNQALEAAQTPDEISDALELMHPLTLNRLQPGHANQYLQEHAKFYELEQPEIIAESDSSTIVNIAGHRRYLALEFIAVKLKGLSLSDVRVKAQIHDNLLFPEALALQLRENVKTNPTPQDEAKAIDRFYQYVTETTGVEPTYVNVANRLGFRPGKVRDALAFRQLPQSIQDYVGLEKNGAAIPYSTLVEFRPLQDALRARYEHRYSKDEAYSDKTRDEDVTNDLHIMANTIAQMRLKRQPAADIEKALKNRVRIVQGEILITAETLFDVEGDDSATRRRHSSNNLAGQAILMLQLLAKQNQLSDKHKQELDALKAVHDVLDLRESDDREPLF